MRNIIFIGGAHGRSGTNILKRLLCTHTNVSWVLGDETRYLEFLSELMPNLLADTSYLPRNAGLAFNHFSESILNRFGRSQNISSIINQLKKKLNGQK